MLVDHSQQKLANVITNSTALTNEEINNISIESIIENGMVSIFLEKIGPLKYSEIDKLHKVDNQLFLIHELQKKTFDKIFNKLNQNQVQYTVLKGWALSYGCYTNPHNRPKTDIDILIPEEEKNRVKKIFNELGYTNPRGWEPKAIIDQYSMRKVIIKGIYSNIDVHLKLTNDKALQPLFPFTEVMEGSSFNNRLGACTIQKPLALLHAIIHLLHHSCNADYLKLIWFYDIHLLVNDFSDADISKFLKKVDQAELAEPVTYALLKNQHLFPSIKTETLIRNLRELNNNEKFNYLMHPPSKLKLMLRNFRETKGLESKLLVIRETFLPPKEEIYLKYGRDSNWPLFLLYFRRIVTGIFRFFKL